VIASAEWPYADVFGIAYSDDPRCEGCGRSIVTRFGGVAPVECPSCMAEFSLLNRAGKLEVLEVESERKVSP
jgi:ribosomal protein S27E